MISIKEAHGSPRFTLTSVCRISENINPLKLCCPVQCFYCFPLLLSRKVSCSIWVVIWGVSAGLGLCRFSRTRGGERVAVQRGNGRCSGGMRSVCRGDPSRSLTLVSGGDGAVLVRVGPLRPPAVLLLFPLHAPVLEPDLDVALGEAQGQRQLHAPRPGDVAVKQELLLQLQQLRARVGSPRAFVLLSLCHHVRPWTDRSLVTLPVNCLQVEFG